MLHILHQFGYIGLVLTVFGEIALMLFFLPGDSLIFGSGLMIYRGLFGYWTVIFLVFLTSMIAGEVGYFIGTKIGRNTFTDNKFYKIKERDLKYTEEFFTKYGAFAIIFSRFVPIIRNFISPVCGILKYNKRSFFIYNLIASFLWPLVIVSFGYYFGRYFPHLIRLAEAVMLIGILAIAAPFIFNIVKTNIKKRIR